MFHQTDKEFPSDINHFGCFFISILYVLEKHFGVTTWKTHADVLKTYKDESNDEDLGQECFVNDAQKLADSIIGAGKIKYLGKKPSTYVLGPNEFEIHAWFNKRTNFTHFVVGDGKGITRANVEFDPILNASGSGSITVKEGVCQSKRVFKKL